LPIVLLLDLEVKSLSASTYTGQASVSVARHDSLVAVTCALCYTCMLQTC